MNIGVTWAALRPFVPSGGRKNYGTGFGDGSNYNCGSGRGNGRGGGSGYGTAGGDGYGCGYADCDSPDGSDGFTRGVSYGYGGGVWWAP